MSIPVVEKMIDLNQASEILGVCPATVREMAAQGKLPATKIGRLWRFRASSLDKWIDAQLHSVQPSP